MNSAQLLALLISLGTLEVIASAGIWYVGRWHGSFLLLLGGNLNLLAFNLMALWLNGITMRSPVSNGTLIPISLLLIAIGGFIGWYAYTYRRYGSHWDVFEILLAGGDHRQSP